MALDLTLVIIQLYRYISPFVLFFGTIGSILNILIFSQKKLRIYACSLYYLTQSIISVYFLYTTILYRYLNEGYQINLIGSSQSLCKYILYTTFTCSSLSPLFIVWSSIDRYLASSPSERLRGLSKVKYTIYTIPITIISIHLVFIYVLIYFGVSASVSLGCTTIGYGVITQAHNFFKSLGLTVFVFCLLTGFSVLTLKNVQRQRQLVHATNITAHERRDRRMITLMLCQSFNYLLLVFPSAVINIYTSFIPPQTSAQLLFIFKLLNFLAFIHPATSFYLNTLVSRIYRHELIKNLDKMVKYIFHSTVIERYMLQAGQEQRNIVILRTRKVTTALQVETGV